MATRFPKELGLHPWVRVWPVSRRGIAAVMPIGTDDLDVLIPTVDRPGALAMTLTGLAAQDVAGFRVLVSDQSPGGPGWDDPGVQAALRLLRRRGCAATAVRH